MSWCCSVAICGWAEWVVCDVFFPIAITTGVDMYCAFKLVSVRWAYRAGRFGFARAVALSLLLLGVMVLPASAQAYQVAQLMPMVNLPKLFIALSADEQHWLKTRRVLRLGIDATQYEPLELLHGQALKGITADYLAIVGDNLRMSLEVQLYRDRSAALAALRAGEVDILGHGSSYEEQLPGLLLSRSYVENRPVLVARKKVLLDSLLAPLKGGVAIEKSYTSLSDLRDAFPQLQPARYATVREGLHAVDKGSIEKFIGDEVTSSYQLVQGDFNLKMRPLQGLKVSGYSFAFRQEDVLLRDLFDRVLSDIPDITHATILNYWGVRAPFGDVPWVTEFNDAERAWLATEPEIQVAVSSYMPPFSFLDDKGDFRGLFPDLLAEIDYYSGLRFKLIPVSNSVDRETILQKGKIDMTVMLQGSKQQEAGLLFTQPFMQSSFVLIGRSNQTAKGLADLRGKRVALTRSSLGTNWIHKIYPGIDVLPVEQALDALSAVADGRSDYALLVFPVAEYLIDQYFADDLSVLATVPELDARLSFTVRNDLPQLHGVLEKSLDRMGPGHIGKLLERWRNVKSAEKGAWSDYLHLSQWLSLAGGVVLFLSLSRLIYSYIRRSRRQAETSLQSFRSSLLDGIPQPITVRDLQGRFVLCNQAFYKSFGLTTEQVIGSNTSVFLGLEEDPSEIPKLGYFALLSKGEADVQQVEMTIKGQRMVLQQWAVPYKGVDGLTAGLIMGWVDMTPTVLLLQQLQVARDQAVEGSEAKSRFLAVMSHEIRTPLNAIIGLLELTMRRADQGEAWDRNAIEVAYSSSSALLLQIEYILDLAKIESGKLTLEPQRCNQRDVLNAVVRVFDGVARQKGLYLHAEVKLGSQCDVLMDAGRLKQVLSNLLSNAIKFTDKGRVRVVMDGHEDDGSLHLYLDVVDTGIGVSAEDQTLLFEPFSQAGTQRTQRGGTGLGLVICQQLIEMMGGSLRFESTLGSGTAIHIELAAPILAPALVPALSAPAETEAPTASLRVLLVDDHPANRLLLGQQLRFLGHTLCEAEDGAQAFALFEVEPFDAVITDVNMPIMNGYELARKVRLFEAETLKVPCRIIGFTANAQVAERQRCLDAGMDECLFKPVGLDVLKTCLGTLVPRQASPIETDLKTEHDPQVGQFDMAVINSLTGGDQQLLSLLFNELHKSNSLDLRQLDEGLSAGRWRDQGQLVHRFKGAARMFGAHPVVQAALAYENGVAESVSDDDMQRLASAVRHALVLLQAALADWLAANNE